jgi:L-ascorbate metabolism protein UlaG (beta-lactamase superfamily)
MQRFVDQCDVLFISHRHRDHVDRWTAQAFIRAGKPVIAPPQVWTGKPIHDSITHLKREAHTKQPLNIKNGSITLHVVIYPGHQMSKTENNVSLVYTPEGITVCHMGDQINEGEFMIDYEWIDHVADHHKVDILLPPCWTNEIFRIVKGFDPKLVIPGHENELGHGVYDRVPFWGDAEYLELIYPELKASDYPLILMTWGETYHFK